MGTGDWHELGRSFLHSASFFVHTHVEVAFVVGRCQLELLALPVRVQATGVFAHLDRAAPPEKKEDKQCLRKIVICL